MYYVTMAILSSIDLQWEKRKLAFIAISLQIFWQKFNINVSCLDLYQIYHFNPKHLNLMGCHGNRKVNLKKNLLLRSYKGKKAET